MLMFSLMYSIEDASLMKLPTEKIPGSFAILFKKKEVHGFCSNIQGLKPEKDPYRADSSLSVCYLSVLFCKQNRIHLCEHPKVSIMLHIDG
jgi:hypothetical protein